MSRTAIAVQTIPDNSGAAVTFAAADSGNGMLFPNNGRTALKVKNASGSPITVTVHSVACSHGRTGDLAPSVAAGAEWESPKLDPTLFNQLGADLGSVYVDFSASTSVTVAAVSRN
jgi:hypothetical protein